MKIEKEFVVQAWDESARHKTIDFWSRKQIVFSETGERQFIGKRGNLWGNLSSFDMSKIMAKITITVSEQNEVRCVLEINPVMQKITEWNKAWWDLEMDSFATFLLQNDEQVEKWQEFLPQYYKAARVWMSTAGLKGNKIPPKENR